MPIRSSSDSDDASSSSSSRRKKRHSRKNSRRSVAADDDEEATCLDYLGVRNDLNLKGLFKSIGFGAEHVRYSDHANLVIMSDRTARSPTSPTNTAGNGGGNTISKSATSSSRSSSSGGTTRKKNSLPKTLSLLTGGGSGSQLIGGSSSTTTTSGSGGNGDTGSGGCELPRAEEYAVVVTNQAIYLFAPQIESGRVRHLICNCYVRIKLSEILGTSLPYRSRGSTHGEEYALRSDEFALHLVGRVTLWLEAYPGKRSEFAESISMVYEKLLAQELPMEHPDRDELVRSCVTDKVWSNVLESVDVVWAKSPILKQGWLYHQVFAPNGSTKTEWRKRWCALSVSQIRYFDNPEEMEALRFLLCSPKNKRANLPNMSRDDEITLGLYHLYKISFTPEEGVTDYGFEIANVDFRDTHKDADLVDVESRSLARMQRFRHVFRCASREEATQWILGVQTRFSTQQRRVRRAKLKAQRAFEEELKSLRLQEAELLRAAQRRQGVGTRSAPSSSDGKHAASALSPRRMRATAAANSSKQTLANTHTRARHTSKDSAAGATDLQNADPQIQRNVSLSLSNGDGGHQQRSKPPRKETEADLSDHHQHQQHPTHRRSTSSPVSLISRVLSPLSFTERDMSGVSDDHPPLPPTLSASNTTLQASRPADELSKTVVIASSTTKRHLQDQGPASATDARDTQPRKFSAPLLDDLDPSPSDSMSTVSVSGFRVPNSAATTDQSQRQRKSRRSSREFDSLPCHKHDSGAESDDVGGVATTSSRRTPSRLGEDGGDSATSSSSRLGGGESLHSRSKSSESPAVPRSLTTQSHR